MNGAASLVAPVLCALAAALSAQPTQIDFKTQVLPIFEKRCFSCHGPQEQEADLRLDRKTSVFHEGGPAQWVIVPGKAKESPLFERITLPADDFDVMPAEGDPLTPEQIAVIRDWIDQGAPWPDDEEAAAAHTLRALSAEETAAAERAMAAIRARGGRAERVAADTPAVSVGFALVGEAVRDDDLALLDGLEPVLVWLDLSRTGVTTDGVARLAAYGELRRLSLAQTAVGDAGLTALAKLPRLEFLNLWGTAVGDAGLEHLRGLKSLRKLYLWQTAVTQDGARSLQEALPALRIDRGGAAELLAQTAREQQPVNDVCPVAGKPVDPAFVLTHDGAVVAFCCEKCRAKFLADPSAFTSKIGKRSGAERGRQEKNRAPR